MESLIRLEPAVKRPQVQPNFRAGTGSEVPPCRFPFPVPDPPFISPSSEPGCSSGYFWWSSFSGVSGYEASRRSGWDGAGGRPAGQLPATPFAGQADNPQLPASRGDRLVDPMIVIGDLFAAVFHRPTLRIASPSPEQGFVWKGPRGMVRSHLASKMARSGLQVAAPRHPFRRSSRRKPETGIAFGGGLQGNPENHGGLGGKRTFLSHVTPWYLYLSSILPVPASL